MIAENALRQAWKNHVIYLLFGIKNLNNAKERFMSLRMIHFWSTLFSHDLVDHISRIQDMLQLVPSSSPEYELECTLQHLILQIYRSTIPHLPPLSAAIESDTHFLTLLGRVAFGGPLIVCFALPSTSKYKLMKASIVGRRSTVYNKRIVFVQPYSEDQDYKVVDTSFCAS